MRLVYAAPVPHSSFAQRAHHFVAYFNERYGGRTLWINPYPGRLPRIGDLKRPTPRVHQRADADLDILLPPLWAADPLMIAPRLRQIVWKRTFNRVNTFVEGADWVLAIGRPSLLSLDLLRKTAPRLSCYDAMDDFPEFYSGCSRTLSRSVERRIARGVDAVLVTSRALQQKFDLLGVNDIELLRNGLDMDGEWPHRNGAMAAQPVFGYIGTIGTWFDWTLIDEMATACRRHASKSWGRS